jgi:hypothetical protein
MKFLKFICRAERDFSSQQISVFGEFVKFLKSHLYFLLTALDILLTDLRKGHKKL